MRVAYFGPAGTYTHAALIARFGAGDDVAAVPLATIHDVVIAVQDGAVARGVVPIENSLEGSVNATLDALAFDTEDVVITGELVLPIHHCLIARPGVTLQQVTHVASHPQALAQCAGFLRTRLPGIAVHAAASTAEAVRGVVADGTTGAALGPRSAAERYGGEVLESDVEDAAGNQTRFAVLGRRDAPADGPDGPAGTGGAGPGAGGADAAAGVAGARAAGYKTAIAFWPRESDHAGWLVTCLAEFARGGVNLTRIESRPRRVGLGEYVFFVDLDGGLDDPGVSAGLSGVGEHVAQLRVLGSFPVAPPPDE